MNPTGIEIIGTIIFGLAILHTFLTSPINRFARRFPEGSTKENFFHLLGEVEIVFGFWAGVFILFRSFLLGPNEATLYIENLNFTEPMFVFAIMTISATRPIIYCAGKLIYAMSHLLPLPMTLSFYAATLILGPLLGSLITEPAAMTVTALLLKISFFDKTVSNRFKYITLSTLLVNISVGGVLTHFAAPPVIMVSEKWGWGTAFMFQHFGWKAIIAILLNTFFAILLIWKELASLSFSKKELTNGHGATPFLLIVIHLLFLVLVVFSAHHMKMFMGFLLFFLGITAITKEYQDEIKLRESLLVGFFLAGLVILGFEQRWWLTPLLNSLNEGILFIGAAILTSFTDNAALTYLASQVENLSDSFKYALMAGAIAGGGLTVIANAPNPAGFSILKSSFQNGGIGAAGVFVSALIPTSIAMLCFWLLPSL